MKFGVEGKAFVVVGRKVRAADVDVYPEDERSITECGGGCGLGAAFPKSRDTRGCKLTQGSGFIRYKYSAGHTSDPRTPYSKMDEISQGTHLTE